MGTGALEKETAQEKVQQLPSFVNLETQGGKKKSEREHLPFFPLPAQLGREGGGEREREREGERERERDNGT